MFTLGLLLQALGRAQGDRRRPVDPQLHLRGRRRARARPTGSACRPRRCAPSGRRSARGGASSSRARTAVRSTVTCSFLFGCTGYYRYDEPLHARLRGHRALRRHARPPAALARGPRLRRQACRRHRQRRDRGHARAGDGGHGRARDDAPALAELRAFAARTATRSRSWPGAGCPRASPTRSSAGRTP